MVPMNLFAEQIDTDVENKHGRPGGNWASGMNWETGVDMYTLLTLCIKQIMNMNLLYGSGNPTRCSVVTLMGRKSKEEGLYVYLELIHFAVHQKLTTT